MVEEEDASHEKKGRGRKWGAGRDVKNTEAKMCVDQGRLGTVPVAMGSGAYGNQLECKS